MNWTCTKCEASAESTRGTLSLIRHGRTDLNEQNRTVGSIDEPMNETGWKQVQATAQRFKESGVVFDYIFSSPLKRARDTAEVIGKALGVEVVVDERLRERRVGAIEGTEEPPERDQWLLTEEYDAIIVPTGAEPLPKFEARIREVLSDYAAQCHEGSYKILLVTHGLHMIRDLMEVKGWTADQVTASQVPGNAELISFGVGEPCKCGNVFYEWA